MRTLPVLATVVFLTACQRTPDQQQTDLLRNDAQQRGSAIENQANIEADRLQQQAEALYIEAEQRGGLTGNG